MSTAPLWLFRWERASDCVPSTPTRGWWEETGQGLEGLAPPGWLPTSSLFSPFCLQFLMTSLKPMEEQGTACLKAKAALLDSLQHKAFQNPLVISQLLPVLNQKSYVALISPNCQAPKGSQAFPRSPLLSVCVEVCPSQ